jgi:group I intron endonuclease
MFYIVYKTTNQVNGKFYIGTHKTVDLNDDYLGSGKLLKRAIEKYGAKNFKKEILFVFDNPEAMFAKEAEIVNEDFLSEHNTYNLKKGGFGGFDLINSIHGLNQKNHTNEQRSLAGRIGGLKSAALHGIKNFKGKRNPKPFQNKLHTEETKKRIGEISKRSQTGSGNSQYGKIWIFNEELKQSIRIYKNEQIPSGWKVGRKIKWN